MILHGHVIDKLKEILSDTVQTVVTSPPYWGLRDYGTATWEGGDKNCDHRIDRANRKVTNINQNKQNSVSGEFISDGNSCPKCGAIRKDNQLGLEETPEEFVENLVKVFREVKRVLKDDGTVWLNLGDSYNGHSTNRSGQHGYNDGRSNRSNRFSVGGINGLKPKDLIGIPWRVALALQGDGWYLRQDIIWHKPNPMPESVTDRCTKAHEYIFLLSKSQKYYYDAEAIKEPVAESSIERLNQNIEKQIGTTRANGGQKSNGNLKAVGDIEYGRNKRSVWTITTKPYKEAHFAVFPPKIPELCIKAGSSEGDTVLDPFFGSGTTGWVAQRLGRKWIGIELNAEYIKIAEKRFIQHELF